MKSRACVLAPARTTSGMHTALRVDADFAEDFLGDLYEYRHKRRWLAFLLWGTLGIAGGHRFYMDRPATGLLMLFSLGGAFVWWITDLFLVGSMVRQYNEEQERRRGDGLPPLQLDFMPPLWKDVLGRPPEWTHRWRVASRFARARRFAGDVTVLAVTGMLLGVVAKRADVWEAVFAVLVLAAVATAGSSIGRVAHVPILRGLVRWSHRMRLYYYYSTPGTPLALLFRPLTGTLLAPFRRRARAEARLYLQLGGVFTLAFLLLDFGGEVLGPVLRGEGLPGLGHVFGLWLQEATLTFVVIYAFATPIGAILTLYLLMLRTHTVPRLLSLLAAGATIWGLLL
jgi:hypothetical protein